MTRQKHLKGLVRARMEKTGESYSAARRHIVDQLVPTRATPRSPWHYPGSIPIAAGMRALLAGAGVTSPKTRQPFTEAMVFGIAGGIGAGVFAFHYAKENFSSFYIAGRHLWQDDLAYAQNLCARVGVTATIREAGGGKIAARQLQEALESGPVLAWVDSTHLPHRAMPAQWSGGGYHVIVIHEVDSARGIALMSDLADEPIEISLDALAESRARIKKQKHRILSVAGSGKKAFDLENAVREGMRALVRELASPKTKNFTLEAFKSWGERLHGSTGKESWEVIFPTGRHLWIGLTSIHSFIEHYGTGGGLCRPMYAEFLTQASAALGDARLAALGERYAALGRGWSALADAALPDGVPAFREAKAIMALRSELLHRAGDHREAIGETWRRLSVLESEAAESFPMTGGDADALRRELQGRVLELYEGEVAAQKDVGAWAG